MGRSHERGGSGTITEPLHSRTGLGMRLGLLSFGGAVVGLLTLLGCAPAGLFGDEGVLVLRPSTGLLRGFGVATGGTVTATVSGISAFGSATGVDLAAWRVEVDDPAVLDARIVANGLVLSGLRDGVGVVSLFDGNALVDRFRIAVGTPASVALVYTPLIVPPSFDPIVLRAVEAAPGVVSSAVAVWTDAEGRVVLDDTMMVTLDGADRPFGWVGWVSEEGATHTLAVRAGDLSVEETIVVTAGTVDAIVRVGSAFSVAREPRGGEELCFVGAREGRTVLNAPIVVEPTAPQRVSAGTSLPGITCVSPSGPGILHVTAPGADDTTVALDVRVGP